MEALGIASSIAGLISLADVVAFKISRYYTLVKSAHSDIKDLLVEIQSLYGVLNSLRLLATCLEDNDSTSRDKKIPQLEHFQICRKNLDHLKRSLAKMDLDSMKPLAATKAKLMWPFKAVETRDLVAKIERNKRDLSDALTADGLTALVAALSSHAEMAANVASIQNQVQIMAEEKAENESDEAKKKIFDWFPNVNPYQKHRNAKSLRHPNTVLWYFDSPEHEKWVSEPNSAIWLYGIPGAGKTILTSAVIEQAKVLADKELQHAVAYFYCEYKLPETQILHNILGSLIKQICATSDDAFDELEAFYSSYNIKGKEPSLPSDSDLEKLLKSLSRHFECVMIIVDGLDECSIPEQRSALLQTLSSMNAPEHGNIKVVFTSRDEIDIRRQFAHFESSISIAARSNDLELYVAANIENRIKNRSLRMKDPALKEIIINGIVSKANGMFQWAKCQLDYLCLLSTDRERRQALDHLPKDLFETYERILQRVNNSTEGNKNLVERTLRWLATSDRKIHVSSIQRAVAIEAGSSEIDVDDVPDEDSILWWCSSLVSKDDRTGTIAFSHFTVKEFLTDDKLLDTAGLHRYHMDPADSERILVKACLTYLQFSEFAHSHDKDLTGEARKMHILTSKLWVPFIQIQESNDEVFRLLQGLFHPYKSSPFMLWLNMFSRGDTSINELDSGSRIRIAHRSASTLHFAAILGLKRVCNWLLEQDVDINLVHEELGTPIICAIRGDFGVVSSITPLPNTDTVKVLLEHGARGDLGLVESRQEVSWRTANRSKNEVYPMNASLGLLGYNHEICCDMFLLLVDFKAISPCSEHPFWDRNWDYDRSSRRLSRMLDLFRSVLVHPNAGFIDSESKGKIVSFITRWSENSEDQAMIANLLDKFDPSVLKHNAADMAMDATIRGQTHLIKKLIEEGIGKRELSECIPFAASYGFVDILGLLLEVCPINGDLNANIQKAWICAVRHKQVECVKEFVRHGMKINAVVAPNDSDFEYGPRQGTALAFAVVDGSLEVVKYLSTIEETDFKVITKGCNLLHLAGQSPYHRSEIVGLILDKGVDPTDLSGNGGSVLHYLFKNVYSLNNKDLAIARTLVNGGCATASIDQDGNSLLHILLGRKSLENFLELEEFVELVHGFGDLKIIPNTKGELPLQLAVRGRASSSVLRKLIPNDLSLWNSSNSRISSALHDAVVPFGRGNFAPPPPPPARRAPPRNLPPPPPPPPQTGMPPSPPVPYLYPDDAHIVRILKILIEVEGVKVDVVDETGDTPLIKVCRSCFAGSPSAKSQVIEFLIEHGADVNWVNSKQWTSIHYLAGAGFDAGLRQIAGNRPDISLLNDNGFSPLHQAISDGRIEIVKTWFEIARSFLPHSERFRESIGQRTTEGLTCLHLAAANDRSQIIHLIANSKLLPDINVRSAVEPQTTALHIAASRDYAVSVQTLLQLGADIHALANGRDTPLHAAASQGAARSSKVLIEYGAKSDLEDNDGRKPWQVAESHNHTQLKLALEVAARHATLQEKGDISSVKLLSTEKRRNSFDSIASSNSRDNDDEEMGIFDMALRRRATEIEPTNLEGSVEDNNLPACKALLATGSDPNYPLNDDQETALLLAARKGHFAIVELMLENGALVDAKDKYGNQALHLAAMEGNGHIIETLVKSGASISARNQMVATPLILAAENGRIKTVRTLLEYDRVLKPSATSEVISPSTDTDTEKETPIYLEARQKHGLTALLCALDNKYVEVANLLIEKGANIYARDLIGDNALWFAGSCGDLGLIKMLHSKGVNINQTRVGSSALHNACVRSWSTEEEALVNTEIALWMIGAGADASSNNGWKENALHCASEAGNHYLVKELLKILPASEWDVESLVSGTPLYAAAFRGHIETVKTLAELGVNLNVGCRGESPLEAAVLEGYTETIEFLRSKGAVRSKGDDGRRKDVESVEKGTSMAGTEFVLIEKGDEKETMVETVVEATTTSGK